MPITVVITGPPWAGSARRRGRGGRRPAARVRVRPVPGRRRRGRRGSAGTAGSWRWPAKRSARARSAGSRRVLRAAVGGVVSEGGQGFAARPGEQGTVGDLAGVLAPPGDLGAGVVGQFAGREQVAAEQRAADGAASPVDRVGDVAGPDTGAVAAAPVVLDHRAAGQRQGPGLGGGDEQPRLHVVVAHSALIERGDQREQVDDLVRGHGHDVSPVIWGWAVGWLVGWPRKRALSAWAAAVGWSVVAGRPLAGARLATSLATLGNAAGSRPLSPQVRRAVASRSGGQSSASSSSTSGPSLASTRVGGRRGRGAANASTSRGAAR